MNETRTRVPRKNSNPRQKNKKLHNGYRQRDVRFFKKCPYKGPLINKNRPQPMQGDLLLLFKPVRQNIYLIHLTALVDTRRTIRLGLGILIRLFK